MRSTSRASRTHPVPSMSAWADGTASTANTASGPASIVVDAVTRWDSIRVRRLPRPELIGRSNHAPSPAGGGGPGPRAGWAFASVELRQMALRAAARRWIVTGMVALLAGLGLVAPRGATAAAAPATFGDANGIHVV